jgi:hypothetical protein
MQGMGPRGRLAHADNNLDPAVAERPEELVVYGGTGKAARSWEAFDVIVRELRELEGDQTLLVQIGKAVGRFRTHPDAPRVLLANSLLVRQVGHVGATFAALEALGLDDVRANDGRLVDLHRHAGDSCKGRTRRSSRRAAALRAAIGPVVGSSPQASAAWAARSRSRRR